MLIKVIRAKIHRATVTAADLEYIGSITIDRELMEAAGLFEGEFVLVANLTNGTRHETYAIGGEPGKGEICVNGAAAWLAQPSDRLIIMAHAYVTPEEAGQLKPKVVLVDDKNRLVRML
jgi:aspartate 1-decarboxylase